MFWTTEVHMGFIYLRRISVKKIRITIRITIGRTIIRTIMGSNIKVVIEAER